MSDNWIVANLENAFATWNDKMTEIWSLITTAPQEFKGGVVWNVVLGINGGLQAIGYGLLVLFFAMSIFKSTASFRDFQRPEYALKHFIRFVAAKVAITYAMDLMTAIYSICGGVVESIAGSLGGIGGAAVTLPAAIETAVEEAGFWASIPLWLVTILGSLFITIMSFIMIMSVYGRFFRLYMYTALAPVPPFLLCRGRHVADGQNLCKVLCGRVPGGCGDCACLYYLFGVFQRQRADSGHEYNHRNNDLEIHWRSDFQYAGAGRAD